VRRRKGTHFLKSFSDTVAVMALAAWIKTVTPGEKFDMTKPPSVRR
jgi:hypothetical protein